MKNIIKITDLNLPELKIYNVCSENELKHYYEPDNGIFIAESPNVIIRALSAGYEPISLLIEEKNIEFDIDILESKYKDIPVYTASMDILMNITGYKLTRGVLCAMRRKNELIPETVCKDARRIVVLENVMNPTNVGAIFRSAAALNMDAVLLTRGCCDPLYKRAIRVSMGTVFQIPYAFIDSSIEDWEKNGNAILHSLGFKTVAMALRDDTIDITDSALKSEKRLAVILGTEGEGLLDNTIAESDYTVKIPMTHNVDSLNVAAASAVVFWELSK